MQRQPHPHPWHRGSVIGEGPRRQMDREQRARFAFMLRAHRGVGRITAAAELVGFALLKYLSAAGRCDPSQNTLAKRAGCCERTVRRALDRMAEIGLLRWQRRIVRQGAWRVAQTSNAYEMMIPQTVRLHRCDGQKGRETKTLINQSLTYLLSEDEQALLNRNRQLAAMAAMQRSLLKEGVTGGA